MSSTLNSNSAVVSLTCCWVTSRQKPPLGAGRLVATTIITPSLIAPTHPPTHPPTHHQYVTQKCNKLQAPPLALPDWAPTLTPTALRILRTQGVDAFEKLYGTHFIVGFQMGGFLVFSYKYSANQQVCELGTRAHAPDLD